MCLRWLQVQASPARDAEVSKAKPLRTPQHTDTHPRQHVARVHKGGAFPICGNCGKVFETVGGFQRHMREYDDAAKTKCAYSEYNMAASTEPVATCDKAYSRRDELGRHLVAEHALDIKFALWFTHTLHRLPIVAHEQDFNQQEVFAQQKFLAEEQELEELAHYRRLFGCQQQVDHQQLFGYQLQTDHQQHSGYQYQQQADYQQHSGFQQQAHHQQHDGHQKELDL